KERRAGRGGNARNERGNSLLRPDERSVLGRVDRPRKERVTRTGTNRVRVNRVAHRMMRVRHGATSIFLYAIGSEKVTDGAGRPCLRAGLRQILPMKIWRKDEWIRSDIGKLSIGRGTSRHRAGSSRRHGSPSSS